MAALGAVIVQEGLAKHDWLAANAVGTEEVIAALERLSVVELAARCGIDEDTIRLVARRMAGAQSVAVYEDLGTQMAPFSTLVSYLQRIVWVLLGSYGVPGGMSAHTTMAPLFTYGAAGKEPTDPVAGGAIISGLIPCNELADGILSDHPDRTRALFIESTNPVHSLAGSEKFRQAMRRAEFSVVIDVAMTETAREATFVLPASSQYEKVETTFFGMTFPENSFCIRPPILEPLEGTLPEPEIHSRLLRELGLVTDADIASLRTAAADGLEAFGLAFMGAAMESPRLAAAGAVVLYETLGSTLPPGMEGAAPLWFSAQQVAMRHPEAVKAAGFNGEGAALGNALFDAMISSADGVVFTHHEIDDAWKLLGTPDQKIHVAIPELAAQLHRQHDHARPLMAQEGPGGVIEDQSRRRGWSGNCLRRPNPHHHCRRVGGRGGRGERHHARRPRLAAQWDGSGLLARRWRPRTGGRCPNELTTTDWCDPIAGTPWHKHVPARLEPVTP